MLFSKNFEKRSDIFDQCVACWRWYVEVVAQHKQWCDPRLFFSLSRLGSQRREIVSLQWLVSCSCRQTRSYIVCLLAENLLWDISTWRAVGAGDVGVAMTPPDFGRSANPISTRGQLKPTTLLVAPPGFSDLPTALSYLSDIRLDTLSFFKALTRCVIHWFAQSGIPKKYCSLTRSLFH